MNILSFDIEEWFHILDNQSTKTENDWVRYESRIHRNMDLIFKLLDDTNQKATFFCIGWVARKYPEVIRQIDSLGYEIGTHSDLHQLAFEQDRPAFKSDLETSIKALEDVTGKKITSYRAPGFSLMEANKWVFEVLAEQGIETDCSIFPAKRSHGGFDNFGVAEPCIVDVNGIRLKEFPINLNSFLGNDIIFSGGGYFRLLPLPILDRLMKKSKYVMTYFHPRDFDFEQPMIEELSLLRRFKSYYGLKKCYSKLEYILKNHQFIDLQTAIAQTDWEKVPIKKL